MHDDRDDGKDQQEMDSQAADVHHGESADPKYDENDCEDEKH